MAPHIVLGKGPVGSTTAVALAERGHDVRVLSRSGGTDTGTVKHLAVDAADAQALIEATAGARVIYNCMNPSGYHHKVWAAQWPPIADALLDAAEASAAVLATFSNVYMYNPDSMPLTEQTALDPPSRKGRIRMKMWQDAIARHEAGRIRYAEARASDYFGPGATKNTSVIGLHAERVARGKSAQVFGDPDAPRSWSYVPDIARVMVRLGDDERTWGRAWHVPTAAARSQRQMVEAIGELVGRDSVKVSRVPWWLFTRVIGAFNSDARGFTEVRYQWDGPWLLDSSKYTDTFGEEPTDTQTALAATVEWWRQRLATT